ncbi:MAG: PH domain-containing protein [Candidatus Solibacter sp.]
MHPVSFAAPWDKSLKVSTSLVGALLFSLMFLMPSATTWQWLVKFGLLLLVAGTAAWAPRSYAIDGEQLIVRRFIGSVRISLAGLKSAQLLERSALGDVVRVWAVGGFFGCYGRFLNGLESQTWYVTDRQSCIRLECAAGVVVISPADPAACLAAIVLL